MKGLKISCLVALICVVASFSHADIYEWTDESGIRHFTNFAPPDHAKIVMKTHEMPYDAEADQVRMEAERRERLTLALQKISEREAELERREAEADRLMNDANRDVEEKLQKTEELLSEAARYRSADSRSWYIGSYRCYSPHPHDKRPNCRGDNERVVRPELYDVRDYKSRSLTGQYAGVKNRYDLSTFPGKSRYTLKTHPPSRSVRAPDHNRHGSSHIRSNGSGPFGRNGLGGGQIIFGRQQ